jgi:nucleoside-diphosphate-sugar epimerase
LTKSKSSAGQTQPKVVAVTGGSGKVGRAVCRNLVEHGYSVINLDVDPPKDPVCPFTRCDVSEFGQVMDVLSGIDSRPLKHLGRGVATPTVEVVHLAAVPRPGPLPDAEIFRINTIGAYNVFSACARLGIHRVAWASSETILGLPFDREDPLIAPLDESVTRPQWSYALSKSAGEHLAEEMVRWAPGLTIIGLRLSNVMDPEDYAQFATWQDDPMLRRWNLWGYVDSRDTAEAFRLALEADLSGAEAFVIAAADTVMTRPSAELMREVYPKTPLQKTIEGRETLLSIDKARRLLGYDPKWSWMG